MSDYPMPQVVALRVDYHEDTGFLIQSLFLVEQGFDQSTDCLIHVDGSISAMD